MTKEQYQTALNNIAGTLGTLRDHVSSAFQFGRALGLNDIEIGNDVRVRIKGLVSTRTIQNMLPETAKHMQHASQHKTEPVNFAGPRLQEASVLSHPEIIEIVRKRQDEIDLQREPERQPPKPIEEPIAVPQKIIEVVFDPAPIDRDRTQLFIIQIDLSTKTVKKYKTVGRRTITR
jgi:hypothetical protein